MEATVLIDNTIGHPSQLIPSGSDINTRKRLVLSSKVRLYIAEEVCKGFVIPTDKTYPHLKGFERLLSFQLSLSCPVEMGDNARLVLSHIYTKHSDS